MGKVCPVLKSQPIYIVADAVVVIMIEKLRKLKSAEEEVCPALKSQVDKVIPKLKRVYEFLKDEGKKESHIEWTDRLLRVLYEAEDNIDIFFRRMVHSEQVTIVPVLDVLEPLLWKGILLRKMRLFLSNVTRVLEDQHLDSKGAGTDSRVGEDIPRLEDLQPTGNQEAFPMPSLGTHVSDDRALKDIRYAVLKQISKQVLRNSEHMDDGEVEQALQKELYDQSYLIVLDDYDHTDSWHAFMWSLPFYNKGRVLVTTRSSPMADKADSKIKLNNLGEEDTVKLFKEKVRSSEINLQDKDIRDKIFPASGGLPLNVVLLGGLLMNLSRENKNWQHVIKRVQSSNDILTLSYNILTLSYNYLLPEEKPCFLYLTLFPKATPIPVRRIIRLWLGEELLMGQCDDGLPMNPEDRGEKYLEDLILSNMVEVVSWKPDGTPRTCQVVTPIYDMFRPQAVSLGLLHIHDQKPKDSGPTQAESDRFKRRQSSVRWLTEYSNIKSFGWSDPYYIKRMRSFNSFYTRKGILTRDLGKLLRAVTSHNSHRLLRVLDLEGVYKPYLPGAIERLVLLKYLGLRSTVLDSLPNSIGDLPQLETLDIKNTNIVLPVSLRKSKSLRHLYLNGFPVDPSILKRCTSSGFLPDLEP
ncbi:putative disease resistance RPP13-like protein 2 [Punica granatum]|uniref:Disease resistance RPP13-like protein 2 n=1 Tax=Punica granatum TaxID=22663 RepID=A0A6P8D079_PUNGR|nr:putative disease resistance RPP13-like protein 2 [Punica granatum]